MGKRIFQKKIWGLGLCLGVLLLITPKIPQILWGLAVFCVCLVIFILFITPKAPPLRFPDGKTFAFTIFDDADGGTLERIKPVYDYLDALGIKTTKSVWAFPQTESDGLMNSGDTLADPSYVEYLKQLQQNGFEIASHGARAVSSPRALQIEGMNRFYETLGHYPDIHVNHGGNQDNLYWGKDRFSNPLFMSLYNFRMPGNRGHYLGHVSGSDYFWGDIAQKRITYVRNFVFKAINTYKINPGMPYHDPGKPYVKYWFSSAEASGVKSFNALLTPENLDRLEREGGVCIIYTHLAYHFVDKQGHLNPVTKERLQDLASRNGYFVPVSTLLDFLRSQRNGTGELSWRERFYLQSRWILEKIVYGGY